MEEGSEILYNERVKNGKWKKGVKYYIIRHTNPKSSEWES